MRRFAALLILALWLPAPLRASIVIVNGLSHVHTLHPSNGKAQGIIRVKNEGAKDARILVYRQDLLTLCEQQAQYTQTGSHDRSLGNSLRTNVDERTITPAEEYDVRYTIEIDNNHTAGTYWQVVMVELADPVREQPKNGVQVNSKVRYAIQVIVDIGNFEGPQLAYEQVAYEKVSAQLSLLKVTMKNNSGFGARTNVILEIYDTNGNKLKTTGPNTRMLYPGYCSTFEIAISDLPKGNYDCVIIADTKKDLFGSNVALQIE